jgi:hypothetical protein
MISVPERVWAKLLVTSNNASARGKNIFFIVYYIFVFI